jgi:hypothetical protein
MESEDSRRLDRSVLFAIDGLAAHGKPTDFTSIHFHIAVGALEDFRNVDHALQRLRRRGVITYNRKTGWARAAALAPQGKEEGE